MKCETCGWDLVPHDDNCPLGNFCPDIDGNGLFWCERCLLYRRVKEEN